MYEHSHAGTSLPSPSRFLVQIIPFPFMAPQDHLPLDDAELYPPYTTDEHSSRTREKRSSSTSSWRESGVGKSRVLMLGQMSRALGILKDYCLFRHYSGSFGIPLSLLQAPETDPKRSLVEYRRIKWRYCVRRPYLGDWRYQLTGVFIQKYDTWCNPLDASWCYIVNCDSSVQHAVISN